jgi:hypothetical protein
MARAKQIRFRGEAEGHARAAALLEAAGDVALDRRGVPRALVMLCPDGCGETLTVNLDPRAGKAWRADGRGGRLTLYPSVWRDQGCKAHFIIWRDRLIWCDRYDPVPWEDHGLVQDVRVELAREPGTFRHYEEVATALDAIPWEALWACQLLVRAGEAEVRNLCDFRPVKPKTAPGARDWRL